ncbi:MAG: hypothetical protein ABIH24_06895 [Verrucomicrobiota bacterium]
MKRAITATLLCISVLGIAYAESNDSMQTMTNAEAAVQVKLAEYSRTGDHKLLVEARRLASSMNPRQRGNTLSPLDEQCLRLQLKVLVSVQDARDKGYDPKAPENIVYMNIMPPESGGQGVMAGMDPKAIRDPIARKKYEDAIEANKRKNAKLRRELDLSRCVDRAIIDIWHYVRNFPEGSEARTEANQIIISNVTDTALVKRLESNESPGLTW